MRAGPAPPALFIIASAPTLSSVNTRVSDVKAITGLILTMRPKQWTKNVLFVFPAIVFNAQLFDQESFVRVLACSGLMILAAGCVYVVNDIVDIEADRQHPSKRQRPIASGRLPLAFARVAAPIIGILALAAAANFDGRLALLIAAYLLLQLAYSFALKHIVLLDVLTVAAGFVMRIVAGGLVIDVALSPWLITSGGLLALFLVIGKRRQEFAELGEGAGIARGSLQQYNLPLLDDMLRIVTTCVMITYIIYTVESPTLIKDGQNLGLITVPAVVYGLFRYLYLMRVKEVGSAPDEVLLTDRPLQATIAIAALAYFIIVYLL